MSVYFSALWLKEPPHQFYPFLAKTFNVTEKK